MSKYPCEWLRKAREDIKASGITLDGELPDIAAFHAQQAVEKALKALLVAISRRPPKTHDIDYLADQLEKAGIKIPMREEISSLTLYAVEARYPGPPISIEEAEYAYKLAKTFLEIVERELENRGIKCS